MIEVKLLGKLDPRSQGRRYVCDPGLFSQDNGAVYDAHYDVATFSGEGQIQNLINEICRFRDLVSGVRQRSRSPGRTGWNGPKGKPGRTARRGKQEDSGKEKDGPNQKGKNRFRTGPYP